VAAHPPTHGSTTFLLNSMPDTFTPIGAVLAYAGPVETIPSNWMLCDGKELDRTDEPALCDAIGNSWGGNGNPKFLLPDLRGIFLRGVDKDRDGVATNPPRDPDRDRRANCGNHVGSTQQSATGLPTAPQITRLVTTAFRAIAWRHRNCLQ
jgi:microcystin-dependent protein